MRFQNKPKKESISNEKPVQEDESWKEAIGFSYTEVTSEFDGAVLKEGQK